MDELHIQKVLKGDTEAFRYFVQQYKDMVFKLAMSILKNEFDARDATQDAFIIAFRKMKSFRGRSKFSTWLCRIVINEALKKTEANGMVLLPTDELPDSVYEEIPFAFSALQEEEQGYYIDLAMQQLVPKEAIALTLHYLQDQSLEQIHQITGWSVSNVKVILHRARRSMYAQLGVLLKKEKRELY